MLRGYLEKAQKNLQKKNLHTGNTSQSCKEILFFHSFNENEQAATEKLQHTHISVHTEKVCGVGLFSHLKTHFKSTTGGPSHSTTFFKVITDDNGV